jgi:hypothetical protein
VRPAHSRRRRRAEVKTSHQRGDGDAKVRRRPATQRGALAADAEVKARRTHEERGQRRARRAEVQVLRHLYGKDTPLATTTATDTAGRSLGAREAPVSFRDRPNPPTIAETAAGHHHPSRPASCRSYSSHRLSRAGVWPTGARQVSYPTAWQGGFDVNEQPDTNVRELRQRHGRQAQRRADLFRSVPHGDVTEPSEV